MANSPSVNQLSENTVKYVVIKGLGLSWRHGVVHNFGTFRQHHMVWYSGMKKTHIVISIQYNAMQCNAM